MSAASSERATATERPRRVSSRRASHPRATTAAGTSAILLATTASNEHDCAATLEIDGTTILGRLLEQLETLEVARASIITRPQWVAALERAAAASGIEAKVVGSESVASDLRAVADLATAAPRSLLIARGDALTQREALAGLFADPRIVTGILVSGSKSRGAWSFRTRSARGRVIGAASPYHREDGSGPYFLGLLKVDARDRSALVSVAQRLADMVQAPPPLWKEEFKRKSTEWRMRLWSAAREDPTAPRPGPEVWPSLPLDEQATELLGRRVEVSRNDVVSLLLVGLVRSDVQIAARHLRGFYYGRPLSRQAVDEASQALGELDEDEVALDAAVKGSDGFFTTFFVSTYSRYIARFAARRGWTPNAISVVSMLVGIAAAGGFATGSRTGLVVGAVLAYFAFMLDCVDGQLARYTRQFSKLGAWLDSVLDRAKEYVIFAGLALGATRGFDDNVWLLAASAMALQTARHALDFSYSAGQRAVLASTKPLPLEQPGGSRGAPASASEDGELAGVVETEPAAVPRSRRRAARAVARRLLRTLGRLDRWRLTYWVKRIIVLPIGERFGLIAVTAAFFSPRVTFLALLSWGAVAAAYALLGRMVRSVVRSHDKGRDVSGAFNALQTYRDDGPLARAIGAVAAKAVPLNEVALALIGAGVLAAAAATLKQPVPDLLLAVVAAVVLIGAGSARSHFGRFAWVVPPLLRALEYGFLIRLTVLAEPDALPLCFALLAALAFHHYDTVYRIRQQGVAPPHWIGLIGGGWDARMLIAVVLAAVGLLGPGMLVAGAVLGTIYVTESISGWRRHVRAARPAVVDEEEGADE